MARILAVGVATLDVINEVEAFPAEDSEVRALSQRAVRGGNATNSLVVLGQLGHTCAWAGTYADDVIGQRIVEELGQDGIDTRWAVPVDNGGMPTSCVTVNRSNGSRTIVHYRDLPEYGYAEFEGVAIGGFDWIHFEGRNVNDLVQMLERVKQNAPGIPVSVEMEKPRDGMEKLFFGADVLLFSSAYVKACGYKDSNIFLDATGAAGSGKLLVCSRGEGGAVACDRKGARFECPAYFPPRIVDTLGAGDTFNAAVIDGLLRGQALPDVLTGACRLAGRKCGQSGFGGLGDPDG